MRKGKFITKSHDFIGEMQVCRYCGEGCGTDNVRDLRAFEKEHKDCKKVDLGKEPDDFVKHNK